MNTTELVRHFFVPLIGLGLFANTQAQSFLTNGLACYYPFNGNANDVIGGQNGMLLGGPLLTTDRFGHTNSAYNFGGGTDSIKVTGTGASQQVGQSNTVSLWMDWSGAFSNPADPAAYVLEWGTPGQAYGLIIQNQALPRFGIGSGLGDVWGVNYGSNFSNRWIHVVAVFVNGSTSLGQLFINGTPQPMTMTVGGVPQNFISQRAVGPDAMIAGWLEVADRYRFIGSIDDVRIYDRALDPSEVQQLFQYEAGPKLALLKSVRPSFTDLLIGTKYQLQTSMDSKTWGNFGAPFTATNTSMIFPEYWDVSTWTGLFFQLQVSP
jgi:hypothetical protein